MNIKIKSDRTQTAEAESSRVIKGRSRIDYVENETDRKES
jgi:hypothetical protein